METMSEWMGKKPKVIPQLSAETRKVLGRLYEAYYKDDRVAQLEVQEAAYRLMEEEPGSSEWMKRAGVAYIFLTFLFSFEGEGEDVLERLLNCEDNAGAEIVTRARMGEIIHKD